MRVALDQSTIDSIASAVSQVGNQTGYVRGVVNNVQHTADNLDRGISTIKSEFAAYKEFDTQQKNLINAKSEIVKVRMELEEKFGINKEIRRYLTGILEASDLSLVKKEVINNCTEKMMMDCKGYWLAPCLVALAAWLDDNKELAERALNEALSRDDEKTSLLFALVCRRVGRPNASIKWLERYLAMQDPHQVERKMVSVLDAYSNGLFGQQAKDLCETKIHGWIDEMSREEGFVEAQQDNWEESIYGKVETHDFDGSYPYASKHVTNWSECENNLTETTLHQTILDYFKNIFEKKTGSSMALNDQLDMLLENYISSYDNEELPLRRRERELELIIEERGKMNRARQRLESEQKAMDEILDFTQLLTSAAMHADIIKATNATQRLSIALSKDWIISAYNNIVLKIRERFVDKFEVNIRGWRGVIADGIEEDSLVAASASYFAALRDNEIAATKQSKMDIVLPIICAVLAIFGFISNPMWGVILLLGAGGLVLRFFLNKKKIAQKKEDIRNRYTEIIANVINTVKALCAERVDFKRQLAEQDAVSEETLAYLNGIEAVQTVQHAPGRSILN